MQQLIDQTSFLACYHAQCKIKCNASRRGTLPGEKTALRGVGDYKPPKDPVKIGKEKNRFFNNDRENRFTGYEMPDGLR